MAQDRWINITLEANPAKKNDRTEYNHGRAMGGSAAGDMTVSFDSAKFTSVALLQSACDAALKIAAGIMKA